MWQGRCPKCRGNLYLEADIAEALLLRKCLQCGLIESYFWLERTTRVLVPLPIESDPPPAEYN
jgi:predicted nucleic-acid-binding Zn-ribbon protein